MNTEVQKKINFSVIFDMDGVIVDNHMYHDKAWQLFCSKHNKELKKDDFYKHFGGTNKEILTYEALSGIS